MVENVVEINPNFQSGLLGERKEFLETHIDTPGAWSKQGISFPYCRIVKNVCAGSWYCKSGCIEDLISTHTSIRISGNYRPEGWSTEIANSINETTRDVAGKHRAAVVAYPERGKSGATLGKHVPRYLESADQRIFPFG